LITKKSFAALKTGDKLVDKFGRRWEVMNNATVSGDTPKCMARYPGHDAEELRYLDFGSKNKGVMDEEFALLVELNNPKAFVEKA